MKKLQQTRKELANAINVSKEKPGNS